MMAADVSSSVTLQLVPVRESKQYEHRRCRQHRFSKFSRHPDYSTNTACLYNGRRTIAFVCAIVCVCNNGSGVDYNNGRTDNNRDDHRSAYHNNADSIRYSDLYHRTVVTTSVS